MPRTCLGCASPNRPEIDKALVAGEPLRSIAKRVAISDTALYRHKAHVASAIVKAAERQEEERGVDLLAEAERVRQKAWELLGKLEADGDHRGSIVALREVRECVATLGNLLSRARDVNLADGPGAAKLDLSRLTDEQLRQLEELVTIAGWLPPGSETHQV